MIGGPFQLHCRRGFQGCVAAVAFWCFRLSQLNDVSKAVVALFEIIVVNEIIYDK